MLASEFNEICANLSTEEQIAELLSSLRDMEESYNNLQASFESHMVRASADRQEASNLRAEVSRLNADLEFCRKANRQHVRDLTNARSENSRLLSGGLCIAL